MNNKDLTGRKIVNIRGTPQQKIPWDDVPLGVRTSLEAMLKMPDRSESEIKEDSGKGPYLSVTNWVQYPKDNWPNFVQLGLKKEDDASFSTKIGDIVFNIIYVREGDQMSIKPAELWIGNGHSGYDVGLERVHPIDQETVTFLEEYAKKLI